eukprot:CAMPEP_0185596562 /NCGR_PEP_ID=MMETSP0434-20130131/80827_1 /TAXON_ID=626734 ORGANISM="Favella taraikaensis, Strain Fe Narragansett Bay" /NCGR_SAMPLE_ID=MMETSP0434 /ASSEMBLY_ACC=CAM_ASM_000379 /LENGTH=90 /DNA_ID=CAMNT_0028225083 /DNA_START=1769 /DNA_END=2044 /DNA_ORIENTATION=-
MPSGLVSVKSPEAPALNDKPLMPGSKEAPVKKSSVKSIKLGQAEDVISKNREKLTAKTAKEATSKSSTAKSNASTIVHRVLAPTQHKFSF